MSLRVLQGKLLFSMMIERITVLMMRSYDDRTGSYSEVANLFNGTFPNRSPIHKTIIQKTLKRFQVTWKCRR